jgi:hypothetical protein
MSYISITRILQSAYGVAAQQVGPPFSVYRTTDNSSGNLIQPQNLIADNVRVDRQVMKAGDKAFEGTKDLPNFWYKIMANCNSFLVGDIFILKDLPLNRGWVSTTYKTAEFTGFCLAENMPTRHPIGARLNTTAQLYTSSCLPTAANYFDSTTPNLMPIILVNGKYTPLNAGQEAAVIPVGMMPYRSYGGNLYNQPTPDQPPVEKRLVYMPQLEGYQPRASDRLIFADGSRYDIDSNYHQASGASGGLYVCRKYVTGAAQ